MRYSLFLGCTIAARGRNYELAARSVAQNLDIEFIDNPDYCCCGFPLKSTDRLAAAVFGARNLALAEELDSPLCVLCSACNASLNDLKHELAQNPALLEEVNHHLAKIGRHYRGTTQIKHFSRILYEDVGLPKLRSHITIPLDPLTFAPHYGCHYLKPASLFDGFDDVEHPQSLTALIEATGAHVADLGNRKDCCGGAVLAVEPGVTHSMAAKKLAQVRSLNADGICLICPFCSVVYDDNQKAIDGDLAPYTPLPILYYPQLLGLAMGLDPKALGLNLNRVKPSSILEKLSRS